MASVRESLRSIAASQSWMGPVLKTIGNARCRTWDFIHCVDTCGDIPLLDLNFKSEHKTPGLEYQSHHPAIIRAALASLEICYEDYSLVDFGCGKGRVLLVASEFPFRRISGIEFAPTVAETARKNLKSYRTSNRKCFNVEAITADATDYELPPEAQVLYFYSPFAPPVLNQVIDRIEASWQKSPRALLVLFTGVLSMRDIGFGSRPQYERLRRSKYFDLYCHR